MALPPPVVDGLLDDEEETDSIVRETLFPSGQVPGFLGSPI